MKSSPRLRGRAAKKSSELVPRDFCSGSGFLFGLWLALVLLGPLVAPWASAADPELARMEAALHRSVNRFRSEQRLIALTRNADLDAVARAHGEDMAARGFFAHENPEGQSPLDRIQASPLQGYSLAAENLSKTAAAAPTRETINGWMYSKVHRKNLLAPSFNTTGVGVARAPDGSLLVVQVYVTLPR